MRAEEANADDLTTCDLLIVGGPTQRQKTSLIMQAWLERLPRSILKDVPTAAFDTRYRMSRFLTGSAARRIASRLKRAGRGSLSHQKVSSWSVMYHRLARSAATRWSIWSRARRRGQARGLQAS
ncbi:MAG TPA: hypothetical protein VFA41_17810 [Ktedonobacteraceae bacterium]|nr:hypothetical protein [Ktedonobacteraceae bacterium]